MMLKYHILGALFLVMVATVFFLGVYDAGVEERVVLLSFDVELVDEKTILDVVEVLDSEEVKGTFFVTGMYAVEYPEIVKRLSEGHEVGCHTYSHMKLTKISEDEKREEIIKCKEIVSDVVGKEVVGFRAPYHRIDLWSMMILEEEGFVYDASVVQGLGLFFPETGIGEVPVSSFLGVPLEDVVWMYYLRMDGLFWKILRDRDASYSSYVFHSHHLVNDLEEFKNFISILKGENARFLTHSGFIQKHEGV